VLKEGVEESSMSNVHQEPRPYKPLPDQTQPPVFQGWRGYDIGSVKEHTRGMRASVSLSTFFVKQM